VTTFGTLPGDVVTNSRGDVQLGVVLSLYATAADAAVPTGLLATVTTDAEGRWSYTDAARGVIWVRTSVGRVYATVAPDSLPGTTDASGLTTGTLADARLPVTAQAATLSSTYTPVFPTPPGSYIGIAAVAKSGALVVPVGSAYGGWVDVEAPCSIDRIGFELTTTVGGAGALASVGLYKLGAGGVLTRILSAAAIPADVLGIKDVVVSQALAPGRYAAFLTASVASFTCRCATGTARGGPFADQTDALSDSRGGLHSAALPGANTLPATIIMVPGTRIYPPVIYLRVA